MDGVKHILLVDDDPRDVELTLEALSERNLANAVAVARDGQEALDYLRREGEHADRPEGNPVVMLLDLKMPRVDGFEVLREVRGDPALQMIPVVVLTSSDADRDIVESYRLGVNAYVVKPVDMRQMVTAIRELGLFWAVFNEPPPGSARFEPRP